MWRHGWTWSAWALRPTIMRRHLVAGCVVACLLRWLRWATLGCCFWMSPPQVREMGMADLATSRKATREPCLALALAASVVQGWTRCLSAACTASLRG